MLTRLLADARDGTGVLEEAGVVAAFSDVAAEEEEASLTGCWTL